MTLLICCVSSLQHPCSIQPAYFALRLLWYCFPTLEICWWKPWPCSSLTLPSFSGKSNCESIRCILWAYTYLRVLWLQHITHCFKVVFCVLILQNSFNDSFEWLPHISFDFIQPIIKLLIIYQIPYLRTYKYTFLDFSITCVL